MLSFACRAVGAPRAAFPALVVGCRVWGRGDGGTAPCGRALPHPWWGVLSIAVPAATVTRRGGIFGAGV